jgi:hypothetical protein
MHQQSQNRHLEASLNHKYRVAVLQQELGEHVYGAYGDERHRFHFGPHQIRPEDHRQILRVHFVQVGPLHHLNTSLILYCYTSCTRRSTCLVKRV